MIDPTPAFWAITKICTAAAGAAGGFIMALFHMPERFRAMSQRLAWCLVGAISSCAAMLLTPLVARYFGWKYSLADLDLFIGAGLLIGLVSIGALALMARTFRQMESRGQTLVDLLRGWREK